MGDASSDAGRRPMRRRADRLVEERGGVRIGPFVYAPGLGAGGANDPWKHRKGEPRVFALLWTAFLMIASLATIFSMRPVGSASVLHPDGVRMFVTMTMLGMTVLWPGVRLSQTPPERPIRATVADAFVVLAPLLTLVLPTSFLAGWTPSVSIALATHVAGWAVLIAGLLAVAQSSAHMSLRTGWMVVFAAVALAGPAAEALLSDHGSRAIATPLRLASPLTMVWEVTRSSPIRPQVVASEVWRWGYVLMLSGAVLTFARAVGAVLGGRGGPKSDDATSPG